MNALVVSVALLALAGSPEDARTEAPSNYGEALEAAKFARQPLLVVLEDSQDASEQVAQLEKVDETQRQLLTPYILCRVDVSTPYGKRVAASFKATSFPHTAIIDKTVSYIIYRKQGPFSTGEWVQTLVKYRNGTRPVTVVTRQQPVICRT